MIKLFPTYDEVVKCKTLWDNTKVVIVLQTETKTYSVYMVYENGTKLSVLKSDNYQDAINQYDLIAY